MRLPRTPSFSALVAASLAGVFAITFAFSAHAFSFDFSALFGQVTPQCGNGIVETGEQCDSNSSVWAPCCNKVICKYNSYGMSCAASGNDGNECTKDMCPGNSDVCTNSRLANGTPCSYGTCQDGWCSSAPSHPLSVVIMSPSNGSVIANTVVWDAVVSGSPTTVDFYVDAVLHKSFTNTPYTVSLNTTGIGNGTHTLTVKAIRPGDSASASVTVTVSNLQVAVTAPSANTTVSGTVPVNASVAGITTSATAPDKVDFYVDGSFIGSDSTSPYSVSWDTSGATNGSHAIKAVAVRGGTSFTSPGIFVTTEGLSVAVTAPTMGASVTGMFLLQAAATGNPDKVDFFIDGTLVGGDPAAPYATYWESTATGNGTHHATARAYRGGTSVLSPSVAFTVGNYLPTPGVPDLTAATDSGISNIDNITNVVAPTFTVACTPGLLVTLLNNNAIVSAATPCPGGGVVTITSYMLPIGTNAIAARHTNATQYSLFSAPLSVTIDTSTPPAPGTPDMTPATDLGWSNTDNITSNTTPAFTITCVPGNTVTLYSGSVSLGSAVCPAAASVTITASALPQGTHTITTKQTNVAGTASPASPGLVVQINTSLPPTPGTPDLLAGSDSGFLNYDDVTNVTTPQFGVTCVAGMTVMLYDVTALIGSAVCPPTNYVIITASPLSHGPHAVAAKHATPAGGLSGFSYSLTVMIDAVAPAVTNVTSTVANGNYKAPSVIPIRVTFSKNVLVTGIPLLTLETGVVDGEAVYAAGNGTSVLTFNYVVAPGHNAADLDYVSASALTLNGGTIRDGVDNNATLTLPAPGALNSLGYSKNIVVDTSRPSVLITTTQPSPTNAASFTVNVAFSENVTGFTLSDLAFSLTGGTATAVSGGPVNYTVTIAPSGGGPVTMTVFEGSATDVAGNTNTESPLFQIVSDRNAPYVTSVTSTVPDGTYRAGAVIPVVLNFNENVIVTGTPQIKLSTGTPAATTVNYVSGNGSNALTFSYTVIPGNMSPDLDTVANPAIILNGGTIKDAASNVATLTLPPAGTINSLAWTKNIVIDTLPTITSIAPAAGPVTGGTSVVITGNNLNGTTSVKFGSIAALSFTVNSPTQITAVTPAQPAYSVNVTVTTNAGVVTSAMSYTYVGVPGITSVTPLIGPSAGGTTVTIFGSNFTDASTVTFGGTAASWFSVNSPSTIVATTPAHSAGLVDVAVATLGGTAVKTGAFTFVDPPVITYVTSTVPNATYAAGKTIPIQVVFSSPVYVSPPFPSFKIATGTPAETTLPYSSGNGSTTLTFTYSVAPGNASPDLDYVTSGQFALNGGTIKDAAGNNAVLTLPAPGAPNSLGANKNIVIDTAGPTVTLGSTLTGPTNAATVPVTIQFSEPVIGFSISDVTVIGGSKSNFVALDGDTYTVDILPPLGNTTVSAYVGANVATDAVGNPNTTSPTWEIVSDRSAPTVVGVTSTVENGSFGTNAAIPVTVKFSEPVFVSGTPRLTLETGTTDAVVNFTSVADTVVTFTYTVTVGHASPDLDCVSTAALGLNGGVIKDAAGNNATLALPSPVAFNSLGYNKNIVIDTAAPSVTLSTNVTSTTNADVVTVKATFSEPVTGFSEAGFTLTNATKGNFTAQSSTVYLLDVVPSANGVVTVVVPGNVAKDAASNGNTPSSQLQFTSDRTAPSVTLSSASPNPTNAVAITVTATFSESVTGFASPPDVIVTNASVGNVSGGPAVYTFVVTPSGNGLVTVNVPADAAKDSGGNGTTASNLFSIVSDRQAPTVTNVTSTVADGSYGVGAAIPITVKFSEPVVVTGTPRLTLETGPSDATINYVSAGSSSDTLVFTYTVAAGHASLDLDSLSTIALVFNGGTIKDVVGNTAVLTLPAPGAANSLGYNKNIVIDTIGPSVTLSSTLTGPTNAPTIPVTVQFSEAVTGFDISDIVVGNGTKGNFIPVDSDTYTFDITSPSGSVTASVAAGKAADIAGNPNTASNQFHIFSDSVAPSVTLTSPLTNSTNASTIPLTAQFSETVTGFSLGKIVVANGTAGNFIVVDGDTYNFTVTPAADGVVTVNVPADSAKDVSGNGNSAAAEFTITVDRMGPGITNVTSVVLDNTYGVGTSIPVLVMFNEPVTVTGSPRLTLETGTADIELQYSAGSSTAVLTFQYTVVAGHASPDLDYLSSSALMLNNGTMKDALGNNATLTLAVPGAPKSLGHNKNIVIDTVAPAVVKVTSPAADGIYGVGATIPVTVQFSEPVIVTGTPRLTLETGTTDAIVDYSSGSNTDILTFNYTVAPGHTSPNLEYVSVSSLNLNGGTIKDLVNNNSVLVLPPPGATNSLGWSKKIEIDTKGPTVVLTSAVINPTNAGTVIFTATFSEPVTGFALPDDIVVTNGTASGLNGSSAVYTFTVTPTADGVVTVTVPASAAKDAAGNNNTAATPYSFVSDRTAPVVTITSSLTSPTNAATIPMTVQFNEIVSGFALTDIVVGNGTKGNFMSLDAKKYTFDITSPSDTVSVNVPAGSAKDAAGNDNTAASAFTILSDRTSPKVINVTSPVSNGTYRAGDVIPVTVEFDESVVVTGTPLLTLATGAPAATPVSYVVAPGSPPTTINFKYTVAPGNFSPDLDTIVINPLSLNGGAIKDAAGNAAVLTMPVPGAPKSLGDNKNIIIDAVVLVPPTVTAVSPSSGPLAGGNTVTITGTNFAGVNEVKFGGTNATAFNVLSSTQISAIVPAGSAGAVDVRVTTTGGSAVLPGGYTYVAPPTIIKVDSTAANGSYKAGVTIPIVVVFPKPVFVTGTPQLTLETGTNDAVVNYTGGSGTDKLVFNYVVAPGHASLDLDYISATALSLNGGAIVDNVNNSVVLTLPNPGATNSLGALKNIVIDTTAPTVTLSSPQASPTAVAAIPMTATFSEDVTGFALNDIAVGNGVATALSGGPKIYDFTVTATGNGVVVVTVNLPADKAFDLATNGNAAASPFQITYDARPSITSIVPTSGTVNGGTTVTITGVNLSNTSTVSFGGVPGTGISNVSSTQITAVTPPGTGTVDVSVTTPHGTATLVNAYTYVVPSAVSIIAPLNGATVMGTVTIKATATGISPVSVEFYDGTQLIGTDTTPDPDWSVDWDTSSLAIGSIHTLKAKALLSGGLPSLTSNPVTVTIGGGSSSVSSSASSVSSASSQSSASSVSSISSISSLSSASSSSTSSSSSDSFSSASSQSSESSESSAPRPILSLSIDDFHVYAEVGDALTYTLTLQNLSATTAYGVTVKVEEPFGYLTQMEPDAMGQLIAETLVNDIHWQGVTIPSFSQKQMTFKARVRTGVAPGSVISVIAQAAGVPAQDVTNVKATLVQLGCIEIVKCLQNASQYPQCASAPQQQSPGGSPWIPPWLRPGGGLQSFFQWPSFFASVFRAQLFPPPEFLPIPSFPFSVKDVNGSQATKFVMSDAQGRVRVQGLVPGSYTVEESPMSGWTMAGSAQQTVNVNAGSACTIVTFTNAPAAGATFFLSKTDNKTTIPPGNMLQYEIVVRNTSAVPAMNVKVRDPLPTFLTFQNADNGGIYSNEDRTVTWTIPTLAAGQQKILKVSAQVSPLSPNEAVLENTAFIDNGPAATDTTKVAVAAQKRGKIGIVTTVTTIVGQVLKPVPPFFIILDGNLGAGYVTNEFGLKTIVDVPVGPHTVTQIAPPMSPIHLLHVLPSPVVEVRENEISYVTFTNQLLPTSVLPPRNSSTSSRDRNLIPPWDSGSSSSSISSHSSDSSDSSSSDSSDDSSSDSSESSDSSDSSSSEPLGFRFLKCDRRPRYNPARVCKETTRDLESTIAPNYAEFMTITFDLSQEGRDSCDEKCRNSAFYVSCCDRASRQCSYVPRTECLNSQKTENMAFSIQLNGGSACPTECPRLP